MIRKIISVLLLSIFLVFSFLNNTYANTNSEITVESYKKYLKDNNLKDIEAQFNELGKEKQEKFIKILNNPYFIKKGFSDYNDGVVEIKNEDKKIIISPRTPFIKTKNVYRERYIKWKILGIPVVEILLDVKYESDGFNIKRIYYSRYDVIRNVSPVMIDIGINESEIKNHGPEEYRGGRNYNNDRFYHYSTIKWGTGLNKFGIHLYTTYTETWFHANGIDTHFGDNMSYCYGDLSLICE